MAGKIALPDQSVEFSKKLGRQYQENTITEKLNDCKLLVEKIREEIENGHYRPVCTIEVFEYLNRLQRIVALLIDAGRRFDDRAVGYEERLEQLEQQMEQMRKHYPFPDGK